MSLFKVTDVSLKMHLCRIKKRTSLVIRAIVFEQLSSINRLRAKIHSRNIPRMSIRWIGFSRNTSITSCWLAIHALPMCVIQSLWQKPSLQVPAKICTQLYIIWRYSTNDKKMAPVTFKFTKFFWGFTMQWIIVKTYIGTDTLFTGLSDSLLIRINLQVRFRFKKKIMQRIPNTARCDSAIL